MKTEEPKHEKKEIFYDVLGGVKKYYVGRRLKYPDGRKQIEQLTGYFASEAEANRNK